MLTGKLLRFAGLLILCVLFAGPSTDLQAGDGFVLRAGHLHTGLRSIADGTLVIREGKVTHCGPWAEIEPQLQGDLPVLHWPDAYVTPGMVSASSAVVGPHRGQDSISAAYRAVDGYNTYGDHRPFLATGVTTIHVNPGEHRLLSGQGAVVKLVGQPQGRVLSKSSDLAISMQDSVDNPDALLEIPFPASSDVQIEPPTDQRPKGRISRILALKEALAKSATDQQAHGELARYWGEGKPLRVSADSLADLHGMLAMMQDQGRNGYFVSDGTVAEIEGKLAKAGVPVVLRMNVPQGDTPPGGVLKSWGFPTLDSSPEWALAPPGDDLGNMSWAITEAAAHMENPENVISWVTHHPAKIMGVEDRVGHLEPGADADIVVWNDRPWHLHSRPLEVFVEGLRAWQPQEKTATVIHADTIWISSDHQIHDGEVLIENGKIAAVGQRVAHPPHCQVIYGGNGSYLVPGFIDCYGHLGLQGEAASMGTGDRLHRLLGVSGAAENSVALAGVTSQLLAPRRLQRGAGVGLIAKTAGGSRASRIDEEVSMLLLQASSSDLSAMNRLFGQAQKYLDSWNKYDKDLEEWKRKKAAGEEIEKKKEVEVEKAPEEKLEDPLTGIWELTVSGGPIPEPETATVSMQLTGSNFEGRVIEPAPPMPVRITGTLEGTTLQGTIEVPGDVLPDSPKIEAELTGEDSLTGKISILTFSADIQGTRTSKEAKTFKVTRRKKQDDDGKPLPPRVRANLEPLRAVLEKKIPVMVNVSGFQTLPAVVKYFTEKEISFSVQLDNDMRFQRDLLVENKVPVVLPMSSSFNIGDDAYVPATFLGRAGITLGFMSLAEDGARRLPHRARQEVANGMAADAALEALTHGAARVLGAHDRIGHIHEGMDADLLIWKGHPFETGSRLERVFVHGEEVQQ